MNPSMSQSSMKNLTQEALAKLGTDSKVNNTLEPRVMMEHFSDEPIFTAFLKARSGVALLDNSVTRKHDSNVNSFSKLGQAELISALRQEITDDLRGSKSVVYLCQQAFV